MDLFNDFFNDPFAPQPNPRSSSKKREMDLFKDFFNDPFAPQPNPRSSSKKREMDLFNDPGSRFAPQPNPRSSSKPTKNPKVAKKRAPPAIRAGAAVKVQKVFRGFLVRKNMAIVRKMEAEVDEIERSILAAQEAIRRDGKERIRFNEMLMRCLFPLDSVRGVRDYRKKVIRRVILLQEAVDAISAAGETLKDPAAPQSPIEENPQASKETDLMEGTPNPAPNEVINPGETVVIGDESAEKSNLAEGFVPETQEAVESNTSDAIEAAETSEDVPEEVTTAEESLEASKSNLARDSDKEASQSSSFLEAKEVMEKMTEKMMVESARLQALMVEMCERSLQQCRIMGGLVKRVEKLEKAMQRMEERSERSAQQCRIMGGLVKRVEKLEKAVQRMEEKPKKPILNLHDL